MRRRTAPAARGAGGGPQADGGARFLSRQTRYRGRAARLMSEVPRTSIRRPSAEARAANEGLKSRLAAGEILVRGDQQNGYADVLLGARLPGFKLADRRLINRLVSGTNPGGGRI